MMASYQPYSRGMTRHALSYSLSSDVIVGTFKYSSKYYIRPGLILLEVQKFSYSKLLLSLHIL